MGRHGSIESQVAERGLFREFLDRKTIRNEEGAAGQIIGLVVGRRVSSPPRKEIRKNSSSPVKGEDED
jgi:hypothetical protein